MNTYKELALVFHEQCEVIDGNIKHRKHPGGGALVNTSDPDAVATTCCAWKISCL